MVSPLAYRNVGDLVGGGGRAGAASLARKNFDSDDGCVLEEAESAAGLGASLGALRISVSIAEPPSPPWDVSVDSWRAGASSGGGEAGVM